MAQVAFSIRMDEQLKKDFAKFCEEVGMSMSTAFTVFAKQTLRACKLPFAVGVDAKDAEREQIRREAVEAFRALRAQAQERGRDRPEPTMEEIDGIIAASRKERRTRKALAAKPVEA